MTQRKVYKLNSKGAMVERMKEAYILMLTTVQTARDNGHISNKLAATINTMVTQSYFAFEKRMKPTHDIKLIND